MLRHVIATLAATLVLSGPAPADTDFDRNLSFQQQSAVGVVTPRPGDLAVSAWFDRQDGIYAEGEAVRLSVRANRASWVTVVTTGPKGDVALLYPNALQKGERIEANQTLEIPPPGSTGRIAVSKPYGTELVTFIVSDRPLDFIRASDTIPSGSFATIQGGVLALVRRAEEMNRRGEGAVAVIERQLLTVERRQADGTTRPSPTLANGMPAVSGPTGTSVVTPVANQDPSPQTPVQQGTPRPSRSAFVMPKLDNPFELRLTADRATYRSGEKAGVRIVAARTCYLSVFLVMPDGDVRRIFPNRSIPRAAVVASNPVLVGGGTSPVQIETRPPGGMSFVAVCSTDDTPVTAAQPPAEGESFPSAGTAETLARDLATAAARPAGTTAMTLMAVQVSE